MESNFTNTSLTCKADGVSTYSWEKQDDFIPSSAIGVNTNTLTLINLQLRDAGRYRCIATNDSGSTESDYATLTVKGTYVCVHSVRCMGRVPPVTSSMAQIKN